MRTPGKITSSGSGARVSSADTSAESATRPCSPSRARRASRWSSHCRYGVSGHWTTRRRRSRARAGRSAAIVSLASSSMASERCQSPRRMVFQLGSEPSSKVWARSSFQITPSIS